MENYKNLEKRYKRYFNLNHFSSITHWDQAVMMPEGGGEARMEALAELGMLQQELLTAPELAELFAAAQAEQAELNDWQKSNLREMKQIWKSMTSVSADLMAEKVVAGGECEQAWRRFRAENNWKDFLPLFKRVIKITQEEASQRAAATGLSKYDAMLDLYEPGMSSKQVEEIFAGLKQFIPGFIKEVQEKQKMREVHFITSNVPAHKQKDIALMFMEKLGFDFKHGRLDESHHPFCGGVPQDVRLTTRYTEDDFTEGFMGVLHETGHACYEQGLPKEWGSQPVGQSRSMGIHESQSLLFEMQVGRGREYLNFVSNMLTPALENEISKTVLTPENLFSIFTHVKPDFIRVSADEVTYPMHVILRFEIEKALIEGDLAVEDLPEAWDAKMQEYLGIDTKGNYRDGCMQDIHWTDGSLGYFPTYTLGAMNAAQLFKKAQTDHPEIRQELLNGDMTSLRQWLSKNIWSQGSFYSVNDLMTQATGEPLNSKYFIEHLKERYL